MAEQSGGLIHFWQIHNFYEKLSCDWSFLSSIPQKVMQHSTVSRQHINTWHQNSTIFIWNVNSKTVWTLHWYSIAHWYRNQYKILEMWQLTYGGYQHLQHCLLIPDRYLKRISDPICTANERTSQQDCHYCSLLWLWAATTVNIISAHLNLTSMAKILLSMCELYNSQPALCSQTVFDSMCLQIL